MRATSRQFCCHLYTSTLPHLPPLFFLLLFFPFFSTRLSLQRNYIKYQPVGRFHKVQNVRSEFSDSVLAVQIAYGSAILRFQVQCKFSSPQGEGNLKMSEVMSFGIKKIGEKESMQRPFPPSAILI